MIDKKLLKEFAKKYDSKKENKAVESAIARVGVLEASINNEAIKRHTFKFSNTTKKGEVTNQNNSGRCWMFAALNTARVDAMKKFDLKSMEFSQNYTFFWDKLERSNYFLNAIIDTVKEKLDSRVVAHLLKNPLEDGGQWDMFSAILAKYGVVPKDHMPETLNSERSWQMNNNLTSMLRYFAYEIRNEYANNKQVKPLQEMKKKYLQIIYNVLVKSLGRVPEFVEFEYEDKDGKYHRLNKMTPQEFFNEVVGWKLEDKVSVINAPTEDKPYNKVYTVKYLGTVAEAKPIAHLNLPIAELKRMAIAAIKNGEPVWFGCDVGKMSNSKQGIMDHEMYNFEETLGYHPNWTKAQRLDYGESLLTHAMVFTGVNLDEKGNPITWQVENSWGNKIGKDGVFSMSDKWFDEFTYQIMIDKKYLTREQKEIYESSKLVELAPWDPMGALAKWW